MSQIMKINKAKSIAESLIDKLSPHCLKCEIGGSIRREKPDVKDIEIICIPKVHGQSVRRLSGWINTVYGLGVIKKGKLKNGKYIQIILPDGITLDLFIAKPDNWGMIKLIRTGSAAFARRTLGEFNKLGFNSVEGYPTKGTLKLKFETEQSVFDFLEMKFVEPKYRF